MSKTSRRPAMRSLKSQVLLSLGFLFVMFSIFALIFEALFDQIDSSRSSIKEEWREVEYALDLYHSGRELQLLVYWAVVNDELPSVGSLDAAEERFVEVLEELRAYQGHQDESIEEHQEREGEALAAIESIFREVKLDLDTTEAIPSLANYYYAELYPLFAELDAQILGFVRSVEDEMGEAMEAIKLVERRSENVLLAWMLVLLLLIALFFAAFAYFFLRPISRLHRQVERIGRGDFGGRIEIHRNNELSDLAEAINSMSSELARYASQMEDELHRARHLASIGRLAAGVAHEINNPLAAIAACSEGILRRLEGNGDARVSVDEEDREYLRQIRDEVYRCKSITGKLLNIYRNRPVKLEPVDLSSIVKDVLKLLQEQAEEQSAAIEFSSPNGPVRVLADASQIKQVVLNLVMNAMDSLDGPGRIEIRTLDSDDCVGLEITDSGAGITPEELDQIFEPFFTTKEMGSGTGLGLALSYAIVTAHGGTIHAFSPGRGSGATFRVQLPSARDEIGAARKEESVHANG